MTILVFWAFQDFQIPDLKLQLLWSFYLTKREFAVQKKTTRVRYLMCLLSSWCFYFPSRVSINCFPQITGFRSSSRWRTAS